jgi:ABC-2 type transport system permease protein
MSRALLVARRELHAYVRSPIGCVIIASALLLDGLLFYWKSLSEKLLSFEALQGFFWGASGITVTAGLFLSMRLIAEERQNGSFTLLSTSPIQEWEIVLGKFLSAFGMIFVLTALTAYMPALLFINGKVSLGHIAVGYLGLLLLGAASTAIGLFASAITRSQLVAIIIAAVIVAALLMIWIVARVTDPPVNQFLSNIAIWHNNFIPFQRGRLELQGVAYYIAVTYFFLLSATKILEARRWR